MKFGTKYHIMIITFTSFQDDIVVGNELRQAAFRAYASLGANDEDIRKKVNMYTMQFQVLRVHLFVCLLVVFIYSSSCM